MRNKFSSSLPPCTYSPEATSMPSLTPDDLCNVLMRSGEESRANSVFRSSRLSVFFPVCVVSTGETRHYHFLQLVVLF